MKHEEVVDKFMANARSVMSEARALSVRESVLAVDDFASARDFAALLRA